MANDLDQLKEKLSDLIEEDSFDFDNFVSLSEKIVHLDAENVRFSIDAHHIHRLGFELVGKQETALSELIKNAYDADAKKVTINFTNYEESGGTLIIADNGCGMTEEVIRKTWMKISTGDKEENPISGKYGRSRAGKKGIGRFAVERLGKRLILETKVKNEEKGLRVTFSWDDSYKQGLSLVSIGNKREFFLKELHEEGTTLIIENLRDGWTDRVFSNVWKSVLLLQPPFKPVKHSREEKKRSLGEYETDPGFNVVIDGKSKDTVLKELSIENTFLENRVAIISGSIDKNGKGTFRLQSKKLDFTDSMNSEEKYLLTGELEFETSYLIYEKEFISGISKTLALKMGREYGGMRVYRDGFRVMPYGEPHDDWLRLLHDVARRSILVPSNNYHFFGHVEITSESNLLLEETASREGLIENEAFEEFRKFVRNGLEWAVLRIAAQREKKTTASQKDYKPKASKKPSESTQEVIEEIETSEDAGGVKEELVERLKEAKEEQEEYEKEQEVRKDEMVKYQEMLRILASLGISIGVFSHEIRGALSRVISPLKLLQNEINLLPESHRAICIKHFDDIHESTDKLNELAGYVMELLSHSNSRKKQPIALSSTIKKFTEQFIHYVDSYHIEFHWDVQPPFLRTEPMHRSEIDSALFNFLTNSIKSMKRAQAESKKIAIKAESKDGFAVISFQDTGTGITEEIQHRIFDPFFTTSELDIDDIAGPGTGLGLKIVSDIAEANNGFLRIGTPDQGYNCKIEFGIPQLQSQIKK